MTDINSNDTLSESNRCDMIGSFCIGCVVLMRFCCVSIKLINCNLACFGNAFLLKSNFVARNDLVTKLKAVSYTHLTLPTILRV